MTERRRRKAVSHKAIVRVASEDIRDFGLATSGLKAIMHRAGLTHGGFYNHFPDKVAMIEEAFRHACGDFRDDWLAGLEDADDDADRLDMLLGRYLDRGHRDQPGVGCPFPALAGEVARESRQLRDAFEAELLATAGRIADHLSGPREDAETRALGVFALCVGALVLARGAVRPEVADQVLRAAHAFGSEAARPENGEE